VSFSADAKRIAAGDEAGNVWIWELDTHRPLPLVRAHKGTIWDIAFSPATNILVTAGTDQTVRVWDAESLTELNVLYGHAGEVWRIAFSPDGNTLATGSKDGTARIWTVNKSHDGGVLTRRVEFWNWPVFSEDGEVLAVGERSLVTIRRVNDGTILAALTTARRPIGFVGGNQVLMTLGGEGELQFWNWRAETNTPGRTIAANLTNVRAHAIFARSNLLAVGDRNGDVRLWDFERGTQLATWKAHSRGIVCLAISPDGHVLASDSSEDVDFVKLWSIPDGKLKGTLAGHKLGVFGVAFSPDGRLLASASVDDTCRLWDPVTCQPLAVLAGHKGGAYRAAFSIDGRTLAVGTGDNRVKLWNVATFRDMGTIEVEPMSVFCVGFVPGQRTLAAVSFDSAQTNCSLRLLRALPARLSPVQTATMSQ
jgi:WD40 repeat protein